MTQTRLLIAITPYPTTPAGAPVPLTIEQCTEMYRRIDNLPPEILSNIKSAMTSIMGKHGRTPQAVLRDAVRNLLCKNDRLDVQYPIIKGDVYVVSAALAGAASAGNTFYTCDQIIALDMSGITKEPL